MVIESGAGGLIVKANAFVAVALMLSVTFTVKFAVPVAVGVPLITPAAFMLKPGGNDPDVINHAYGEVPPAADRVCEYGTVSVPFGMGDAVAIVSPWVVP